MEQAPCACLSCKHEWLRTTEPYCPRCGSPYLRHSEIHRASLKDFARWQAERKHELERLAAEQAADRALDEAKRELNPEGEDPDPEDNEYLPYYPAN